MMSWLPTGRYDGGIDRTALRLEKQGVFDCEPLPRDKQARTQALLAATCEIWHRQGSGRSVQGCHGSRHRYVAE